MFTKNHAVRLAVHEVDEDDVYKDLARIHLDDRGGFPAGRIYRVSVLGNSRYLILRGIKKGQAGNILIDDVSRAALSVKSGNTYDFKITRAGWWGSLCWAWRASDPQYRVATKVGVLSLVLGLLSLALAVPAFSDWFRQFFPD